MKTITKKMLSVLMALLVLMGGVWVSFAIEPSADNIEYDTVYDYSGSEFNDNYGAWNYTKLGAFDVAKGGSSTYMLNKWDGYPGVCPQPDPLKVDWGTATPYLIYKVAGGTKFEATFALVENNKRTQWKNNNGAEFEFKIEASASADSGWKSPADTTGMSGTTLYSHGGSNIEEVVMTYDVPADCEYVKVSFPQKGYLPNTTAVLNDFGYLSKVKLFKVKPINYDSTYDYSTLTMNTCYNSSNLDATGAFAIGGTPLYMESAAGLNPGWGALKDSAWGTVEQAYAIYKVAAGSSFEATLKVGSSQNRQNIENATGEPFEFVIEASDNGVDGWKTIGTTDGNDGTADPSNSAYADIVLTCDVPDDCTFVKITFPQKGKIELSWATVAGNDMARLCKVRFFKYVAPQAEFDTTYNYSEGNANTLITDANKENFGIYALNSNNAYGLYSNCGVGGDAAAYSGGIGGGYGELYQSPWGTKNAPYVIYRVKENTKFEVSFRMMPQSKRDTYSAATGEAMEAVIEASATGVGDWTNSVTTEDKQATPVETFYEDVTITYDVPAGCTYVRITLPIKGIVPGTTYCCNDLIRIMGVKYFKYVSPETDYDTIYDYSDATGNTVDVTAGNMANYGIVGLNPDNAVGLVAPLKAGNAQDGGIGGNYGHLGGAWGSKNRPYVIYKVAKGTKFEVTFRFRAKSDRDRWGTALGESLEATIEASSSISDGWKNLVDTKDATITKAGAYDDITITYDVPDDCNYVKITLPMSGIVAGTYRGNDLARIMGVKYFKYVAPTPTYDTTHDYSDTTVNQEAVTGSNISKFGIHAYNNTAKAPELWMNENIGNDYRGGIGVGFGSLGLPWGQIDNGYVIYAVKPGTFFELTARIISSKANLSQKAGEPFEFTIEASSNDMTGWKNPVNTSTVSGVKAGGYDDYVLTYEVPADCSFVKVTFPQKGIIPTTTYRGNDGARIMKVRLNAAKNYYEGCDTVMNYKANGEVDFFYDNDASLIYFYKTNGINVKNFSNGAAYAAPSMEYLNSGSNIEKPYIIYSVESGTKFVAGINVNRTAAAERGADFVMKFYESANGNSWTEVATQVESVGDADYHTFTVAANTKYVKIEYPQTDAVKAVDKVNEIYGLIAVGFNPNEADYDITNPYGNYTFNNVDKFHGEAFATQFDVADYNIYEDIGGVFGYESKIGDPYYYLAYGYGSLVNNNGSDPCGLVYSVKPGTAFQAVVLTSRKNNDCQKVENITGQPFVITVEISSDGENWTKYSPSRVLTDKHLMQLTGVAANRYTTEVMTIPTLPADAKFVKLVYPQVASIKVMTGGADGRAGNDFIGLAQVSFTKGNALPPHLYTPDESKYESYYDFTEDTYALDELNPTGVAYDVSIGALSPAWGYFYYTGETIRANCAVTVSVKEGTPFYLDFAYRPFRIAEMAGENYGVKLLFSSDMNNWTDVTSKYIKVAPSTGALSTSHRFEIDKLPSGVKYVMVEYPHNRDLRGYVTKNGVTIGTMGNDSCGIKRIGFTPETHTKYEHEIKFGFVYEEYDEFPEDVTEETAKVLGFYDFTKNAFTVQDYTNTEAYDGRISVKESYLYNKKQVEQPYVVFNVKPGTEFYMQVATNSSSSRLTIMPAARMKLFASETAEDGSWKEITNYFYTDLASNAMTSYYVNNVGAKTNFIKVLFPNDGDLVAQGKAEGASGAGFFTIKEVKASLVDYNPTWEESEKVDFKKPVLDNKIPTDNVTVSTFNWLWVIIPAAAVLVLAAAALVIILIIVKKKKKNAEPQA